MYKNLLIFLSIVMNGALLMYLTGIMPFLLFVSFLVNLGFIWYIKQLLNRIENIDSDIDELFSNLENFASHANSIYELEMFYGDETLRSLLAHSQDVTKQIVDFKIKYSSEDIFEEYEEGELEDTEYDTTEAPQETPPQ